MSDDRPLTVADLIHALQKLPGNMKLAVDSGGGALDYSTDWGDRFDYGLHITKAFASGETVLVSFYEGQESWNRDYLKIEAQITDDSTGPTLDDLLAKLPAMKAQDRTFFGAPDGMWELIDALLAEREHNRNILDFVLSDESDWHLRREAGLPKEIDHETAWRKYAHLDPADAPKDGDA